LNSDANLVFSLDSTGGGLGASSSELIANSVSLNASSEFTFEDIASSPGSLTVGDTFTVISAAGGLTGTFTNLGAGTNFTVDGNQYQATYTSTALTLTVIPEPETWGLMISGLGLLIGFQRMRKRTR